MVPLEIAMKLASSSANCEKHKCPFASKCKGDYATCTMKEIAMMIRAMSAEIDSLTSMCKTYASILASTQTYIAEIEKINKRYHDLVVAFEHGYRPKKVTGRKRVPKIKKDPKEMDGDERYAQSPAPSYEPDLPVVVI